jgi:putative transposase
MTLGCELLTRRRLATKAEARMAIFEFIEGWYNPVSYCPTSLCH